MQVFINDRFVPDNEACLSLDDAGFVWGATVVERLRTFGGKTFRLDDHLRRFRQSCDGAMIPQRLTGARLREVINEAITRNLHEAEELAIVLLATPGIAGVPTLIIRATQFEYARYAPVIRDGAHLVTVPATPGVDPTIKHRSRLAWWIARQQVGTGRDPLFIGPAGFVRETAAANFIAVIDNRLVCPPLSEVLNGIALRALSEAGPPIAEQELTIAEVLAGASECLLCCSSYGVAPVAMINGMTIGTGDRPRCGELQAIYGRLAGIDILRQFQTNR